MIIEHEELRPGDEIIFPSGACLVYAKVINPPRPIKSTKRYGSTLLELRYLRQPVERSLKKRKNLAWSDLWLIKRVNY